MGVELSKREGLLREVRGEVEGDLVEKKLSEIYDKLRQEVEIKGFRRGKVPNWVLKRRFWETIKEELGKEVINETVKKLLDEGKVKPYGRIRVREYEIKEGPLRVSFVAEFEEEPEFKLKIPEKITIERVNEDEIKEKLINSLREKYGELKEVDREVRKGDFVEVEANGKKEVLRVEGGELIGKKKGEEVKLGESTFKILKVFELKLKDLDEEIAKKEGFKSLEELKKRLEEVAKKRAQEERRAKIISVLREKLLEINEFPLPQRALEEEINRLKGLGVEEEEAKRVAKENLKFDIILKKLVEELKVEVEEKDIRKKVEEAYRLLGERALKLISPYTFYRDALVEKTLEKLSSKVEVVENEGP